MIAPILLFVSSALILQASQVSELRLAIEEVAGIVIAIAGIIVFILERQGRKKEAQEIKQITSLGVQKAVENIPRIEALYQIAKQSGQIKPEQSEAFEKKLREVGEAASVGRDQLEIVESMLKPEEKADSLDLPRESVRTKPIPVDPRVKANSITPHVAKRK